MTKHIPANNSLDITRRGKLWIGQFRCMASPCEILLECDEESLAQELISLGQQEALRAQNCYSFSEGWFDITSGILRRAWNFNQQDTIPSQQEIELLLPHIGWDKVTWENPALTVPQGMEIDFGGIGKEYAVDSVLGLLSSKTEHSFMINFGGDCNASGPMVDGSPWMTGIENPRRPGDASAVIQLKKGALATSGDVFKFIRHEGARYGHILNPGTGWPNTDAPLSVTVAAATCTEAGILSTLAMLQGQEAEQFLDQQNIKYWCYR